MVNRFEYYIGEEALQLRGILKLSYPMEKGLITDLTAIEKMIHYCFYTQMRIDPAEHCVLFLYNPLWEKTIQKKVIEILFDTFNIAALFFVDFYRFILLENKIPNALILDFLDDCITILPYKDYKRLELGNSIINLGFRDVIQYMRRLLKKKGHTFTTSAEMGVLRDIVEKLAYITLDPEKELDSKRKPKKYVLPDGQTVVLDTELSLAPEIYFKPSEIGREVDPINKILQNLLEDLRLQYLIENEDPLIWLGTPPKMENFIERTLQITAPLKIKPSQNILLNYEDIYDKIYDLDLAETDLFDYFISSSLYKFAGSEYFINLIHKNKKRGPYND